MTVPPPEEIRREAIGAFVHDIRAPLASARIVLDLASHASNTPGMTLDAELAGMLEDAIQELQSLTDALQQTSWLERGKLTLQPDVCDVDELITAVREGLDGRIPISIEESSGIQGSWESRQLIVALTGLVEAAHRCGDGESPVRVVSGADDGSCRIRIVNGSEGGTARPLNADLGYGFFHGYALIEAIGGTVRVKRSERFCEIEAVLPLSTA